MGQGGLDQPVHGNIGFDKDQQLVHIDFQHMIQSAGIDHILLVAQGLVPTAIARSTKDAELLLFVVKVLDAAGNLPYQLVVLFHADGCMLCSALETWSRC